MHIFAKAPAWVLCKKCGRSVLPHTICQNCGYYKGRMIIDVLAKLSKREKKMKEKEMKAQEKASAGKKELNAAELSRKT